MSDPTMPLQKKKRPVALIILGILGLIVSISGLVSAASQIVYFPIIRLFNGTFDRLSGDSGYSAFGQYDRIIGDIYPLLAAMAGLHVLVYGLALVASIGLLRNKPWGRIAGQITAGAFFAQAVIGTVLGLLVVSPAFDGLANIFSSMPGADRIASTWSSFMSFFSTFMKIDLIVTAPLACIVPVIVLVVLNKPHIRDHYRELRASAP